MFGLESADIRSTKIYSVSTIIVTGDLVRAYDYKQETKKYHRVVNPWR